MVFIHVTVGTQSCIYPRGRYSPILVATRGIPAYFNERCTVKKFLLILAVVSLVMILATPVLAAPALPVPTAAPVPQEPTPFDPTKALGEAWSFILGSAAIAGAATFLSNFAKQLGLKDGQALTAVSVLNFVLVVAVFLLKLFYPSFDLKIFETVAKAIVQYGPGMLLPLIPVLIWISKWFHERVRGAWLIGYSHSL